MEKVVRQVVRNRAKAVPIAVNGTTLEPGRPAALFHPHIVGTATPTKQQYDVARDGRFLINTVVDESPAPITLIQNWRPPAK